jgi:carbamoyl-phosphate synthase small subunit
MTPKQADSHWTEDKPTALLVLADGTVLEGFGFGASGHAVGEVCFNTAMTGYEEILTDPSYAGQIITFTFPHIGNVGTNEDDIETVSLAATPGARGLIVRTRITDPSNYRATRHLDQWLKSRGVIGLSGLDTRALTALIRSKGMPNAVIAHAPDGKFDLTALKKEAREWPGLVGMDLVPMVTSAQRFTWDETPWEWGKGYGRQEAPEFHVVALDYGIKRNILRLLAGAGCKVTVVPATTSAEDILAMKPDGVFLSNGPGDPAATGEYAVPVIRQVIDAGVPTFGICLGHQMLGIAVGGRTVKMHQGHHGANHPVKDLTTGKVEITSMNHGFALDRASLPAHAQETHVSLFDGSNCGIALKDRPVFSVQYHPEASPGPRDSHYLFARFTEMMRATRGSSFSKA